MGSAPLITDPPQNSFSTYEAHMTDDRRAEMILLLKFQLPRSYGLGRVKKRQILHILWITVSPPSPPICITAEVDNIHTKEFFTHIRGPPPPPPLFPFY